MLAVLLGYVALCILSQSVATEPDVVAVHNTKQLRVSHGRFAVGLAGHSHRFDLSYAKAA